MELNQCINFLLTTAQNAVFRQLNARLACHSITPGQYGVLNCLWSAPGSSPGQIAEQLHLEASTVSSILDRLQKNGLIEREVDPGNRRNIQVAATRKGLELEQPVQAIIQEVNDEVLRTFSEEQQGFLRKALLAIADTEL